MGLDDKGIVVLDNGGYNIKAGYVSAEERSRGCDVQSLSSPPEIFPNAVAKPPKKSSSVATKRNGGFLVSAELYDLPSYSGLFFRRPIERGSRKRLLAWIAYVASLRLPLQSSRRKTVS
mmetsp:Transcript_15368/g.62707  ORF Transcript_15368/g.62707 Transcript_15368/m.62707 type:complete len:119 (-) Transcript_15368:1635-1991(-)